jgi:hypothetical protein
MNRREAIQHLAGLWEDVSSELSIDEASDLDDQTRAALHALGVTAAEIDEAEKG